MKKNYKFTGDWISGFTQSDGSFIVSFLNQQKGVRPQPVFNITQSIVELELFTALQQYLGVGKIYKNRQNVVFVVKSIDEIVNVILPLFDKHPVRGGKLLAYNIFKEVSLMIKDKKHLTVEGTLKILKLAYFMNKETSLRNEDTKKILLEKLSSLSPLLLCPENLELEIASKSFTDTSDASRYAGTINLFNAPLTIEFVRGLVDGDGSFNVSFATTRRRIGVNFTVVNELSSVSVLNELVGFFNCGVVYNLPSAAARFQVQSVDEMVNKIIPFFKNNMLNTYKQERFETIVKVCEIIYDRGYSEDTNLKQIVDLAWDMNKGKRKISKEEYLIKFLNNK